MPIFFNSVTQVLTKNIQNVEGLLGIISFSCSKIACKNQLSTFCVVCPHTLTIVFFSQLLQTCYDEPVYQLNLKSNINHSILLLWHHYSY